jgi:hypothetical protein
METCRLCLKEGELKNSHIIPEFVYSPLYDEKHRFHVLSNVKVRGPAKLQKGIREYLLCGECEAALSKHERYVSVILSGRFAVRSSRNGKLVSLEGLDYKQFRLFGLSVLWRASVSSLQMFEQVKLGPHEEVLRQMLLTEDPGRPNQYPFMLAPIVHGDEVQTDLIMQPTWARAEGHYSYRFVFGGLAWVYLVSSHKPPVVIANAAISEDGKTIMLISDIEKMPFIANFARELAENGQLTGPTC